MEHKSTQTSSNEKRELLENAGLCPTDPRKCLKSHWTREVLSQSLWGAFLCTVPSSLCALASGSGLLAHDTWPLRAAETDQGLVGKVT